MTLSASSILYVVKCCLWVGRSSELWSLWLYHVRGEDHSWTSDTCLAADLEKIGDIMMVGQVRGLGIGTCAQKRGVVLK